MLKNKKYLSIFLFCCTGLYCQEKELEKEKEIEKHHQMEFSITHVNIFNGYNSEGGSWISLPAFSLDYDYKFNEKWSLGLHSDITIEKFSVEENLDDNKVVERSYPFAPAVMVSRKWGHHILMFGAGAEFAKEENLFLNRLGYKYEIELSEKWGVGAALNYDFRWKAYDSYTIGIGVSRSF